MSTVWLRLKEKSKFLQVWERQVEQAYGRLNTPMIPTGSHTHCSMQTFTREFFNKFQKLNESGCSCISSANLSYRMRF